MVLESPEPTTWTFSGSTPVDSLNVSATSSATWPAAGTVTLVPPSKSSDRLKPRMPMARKLMMSRPMVIAYHNFDRPMKSVPPSSR